jgi:hypothetical protein
VRDGEGAALPANHQVLLSGGAVVRYVVRRIDSPAFPIVSAPPAPAGSRSVVLTQSTQALGDVATLRNLTLSGNAGAVVLPPGTYGNIAVGGNSELVLGVVGDTAPAVYHLQNLSLNVLPGNGKIRVQGPVVVTLANGVILNGMAGDATHPDWLTLRLARGGVTLSGTAAFHGHIVAPVGAVVLNQAASVQGTIVSDSITANGLSVVQDPQLN